MEIIKGVPGFTLKFDVREDSTDEIVIREMFDENVYQIHDGAFSDGNDVFVDIGANIGTTSILAYTHGSRHIYAYEPEQSNVIQLNKNIHINNLKKYINTYKKAISNRRGKVTITSEGGGSNMFNGGEVVEAISLDEALAPFPRVALVKIDTEGAEYLIIEGAADSTLAKIDRLVMEFHGTDDETWGLMLAKLSQHFHIVIMGSYDKGGNLECNRH